MLLFVFCATISLLSDVESYFQLHHPQIACDEFGCFRRQACRELCYRMRGYPPYYIDIYCCTFKGKPGICDQPNNCVWQFPIRYTYFLRCNGDNECEGNDKCCVDNCYAHRICKKPVIITHTTAAPKKTTNSSKKLASTSKTRATSKVSTNAPTQTTGPTSTALTTEKSIFESTSTSMATDSTVESSKDSAAESNTESKITDTTSSKTVTAETTTYIPTFSYALDIR